MISEFDAIVTDGDQRVALEITRALGVRGCRVCVVERRNRKKPITFQSRYCSGTMLVEDYDDDEFLRICAAAKAVFPVSTNTIIDVLKHSELRDKLLCPEESGLRQLNDKYSLVNVAEQYQVPYPKTTIYDSELFDQDRLSFPVVFKLRDDENLFLKPIQRYRIVMNPKDIGSAIKDLSEFNKPIVAQEFIDGVAYGYSALFDRESKFVTGIGHKRLREYPIIGGPSTFCQSVSIPALKVHAVKLLSVVGWRGPAMVEFKHDRRDDTFKVIEINPRYWGSLPLARFCGVNLPYIHYCVITGKDFANEPLVFDRHRMMKFRFTDVLAALQEFKSSPSKFGLMGRLVMEFFNPNIGDGIISVNDWKPVLRYVTKNLLKND